MYSDMIIDLPHYQERNAQMTRQRRSTNILCAVPKQYHTQKEKTQAGVVSIVKTTIVPTFMVKRRPTNGAVYLVNEDIEGAMLTVR